MSNPNDITLYAIVDKMEELQQLRESGDMTDEGLKEALDNAWDEIEGDFNEKVNRALAVYRNHKALADAAKIEKERIAAIQKSAEGQMDWMKGYLLSQMQRAGIKKVKTVMGTVSIRAGSESVNITDETLLPDGTYNIPTDIIPDKNEIKRRFKEGEEVPGAELIRGPDGLTIR